jgi:hypothetical protein
MSMFRHINGGWECSAFGEFARLVHQINKEEFYGDDSVYDFIEAKDSPISWELCAEAEPILRVIVENPIFNETGHYETAIALCDAMKQCADKKVDLEV